LAQGKEIEKVPETPVSLFDAAPAPLQEWIEGHYAEMTALLGKRTGELHLALSSRPEEPDFAPEPFSMLYQRSVFQSMRALLRRVLRALKNRIGNLPPSLQEEALLILRSEEKILNGLQKFFIRKFSAMRIRIHGDYHLGQVLYTGKDFMIIDFEGEPARELSERRLKQSPFKDVAGMVRSFHYAVRNALLKESSVRPEDTALLEPWTNLWYRQVSGIFIRSYLDTVRNAPFIPSDREELEIMLKAYLLEKAVYELGYELNNRPEWVITPLRGIRDLMEGE
jgi:maltose alpha-D-glucosyltransferase/alpha-amylase